MEASPLRLATDRNAGEGRAVPARADGAGGDWPRSFGRGQMSVHEGSACCSPQRCHGRHAERAERANLQLPA